MRIQCENRKIFTWGLTGTNNIFFWVQEIKMLFGMGHPPPAHKS